MCYLLALVYLIGWLSLATTSVVDASWACREVERCALVGPLKWDAGLVASSSCRHSQHAEHSLLDCFYRMAVQGKRKGWTGQAMRNVDSK